MHLPRSGQWKGRENKVKQAEFSFVAVFYLKTGVWHLEKAKVEGQKRDQWLPGPGGKRKGDYKKTGIFGGDETSIHCRVTQLNVFVRTRRIVL